MQLTIQIERTEPHLVTLDIEVSAQEVGNALKEVYRELARRVSVSGFRKGNVPREILRRHVGAERVRREVVDRLAQPAYEQALQETSLEPLEQATLDDVEFAENKPLRFKAKVLVKPEVTLGPYKGVAVVKPPIEVTEEEVDRQLSALRESHATLQEIAERGAQSGDVVTVELEVFVDGQPRPEGRTHLRPFTLGESQLVPAIDEHLIGAKAGEERRFNVTYPDDYETEELRDKLAEFHVYVTSVKEKILPDLDDDLAVELSGDFQHSFTTLEQVREHIVERLKQVKEAEAMAGARENVVAAVVNNAVVDVPEVLVERRATHRLSDLEAGLRQHRLTLDDLASARQETSEEIRTRYRESAQREVKRELVLAAIAKQENLTVTPEEVAQRIVTLAQSMRETPEQLRERLEAGGGIRLVEAAALERKTADWLTQQAEIREQEEMPSAAEARVEG